ncbi:short-chain dehydrogenase [Rhodococcus sp. Leaf7]|uniref:SDR family NAD(P)-dependent oxidoreductase n=1 Tax=unclassified Rhodococcus (in: high G+C Gram-positive bacteria) TaxID=192944 RepID=UPI000700EE1C|nr:MULTISPECIES: SDR family NAD(P)-dependent oxidoreductase [unclassified Rhodococcus (in: high G+C Gram-positive bacteria)]KQU03812.1 short-chain dehydrogenase [Rhodococcus sp. Leaf7]KQU39997.1 short-chain dehydrogenase [Rhodococcus sp. Leaf247]
MFTRTRPRLTHGADAVVTGAGSGIGRAFAVELARRGGRVVCADISLERAEATVRMLDGPGFAVQCDVSVQSQVEDLALFAELEFGGAPTVLINNAGVGIGGKPVGSIGFDDWNWALGINLWGVVHGCETFVPQMRASGRGGIINVASAAGFAAAPTMGPYNVGKAGVMSLSETLAAELSGSGVGVTVLCPTFVKTNVAVDGRITERSSELAQKLMRWTGFTPERVAVTTLDALDKGRLYVVPQIDAKAIWLLKRLVPTLYTRGAGLLDRLLPGDPAPQALSAVTTSTGV